MINKKITSILFIFVLMLTVVCSDIEEISENKSIDTTEKKYNVVATTPMLGEFVKQVGQDNINLEVLMPPSVDPHTFKLSPQDVQKVSDADLLFYVGMKYESASFTKLLKSSVQSEDILVEIGMKVNPIEFSENEHSDHDGHDDHDEHDKDGDHDEHDKDGDHDEHAGHDHGIYDPHFWFDPNRVGLAVSEISKQLSNLDPQNSNEYQLSEKNYLSELNKLHEEIDASFKSVMAGTKIVTTHESLGYLQSTYGLEIFTTVIPSLTTEGSLTPKDLSGVIEIIKDNNIKVLFVESEASDRFADVISNETEVNVVTGLWVETLQADESYVDFLRKNVNLIVDNLLEEHGHDEHDKDGDHDEHDKDDDHDEHDKDGDHDENDKDDDHDEHDKEGEKK